MKNAKPYLVDRVPAPPGSPDDDFSMLVSMIEHDSFVGRLVTGRVASGRLKVGDRVKALHRRGDDDDGAAPAKERELGRVTKLFTSHGGVRIPLVRAVHVLESSSPIA